MAFIPLSTPLNQLEDGKTLKLRIAPSQRGETIDMAWWRPPHGNNASDPAAPRANSPATTVPPSPRTIA